MDQRDLEPYCYWLTLPNAIEQWVCETSRVFVLCGSMR